MLGLVLFWGCFPAGEGKPPQAEREPAEAAKAPPQEETLLERAERIHRDAVTLDTHVDIAGTKYATESVDPGIDNPDLRCDLVKMKKGEVDGVFLAAFSSPQPKFDKKTYAEIYDDILAKIEAIHRVFKLYPKRTEWAKTADDFERIAKSGKRAIAIGIENGYPVGDDLGRLKKFHELGTRYITLSHVAHNQICDSSKPKEAKHNGLSEFGKQMVLEMNRLGIMADASHISVKSFNDLIEVSKAPIIASHSGCHALNPHDRNLTDDQLRALAKNGGVIQIVALGAFLKKVPDDYREVIAEIRKTVGLPGWWELSQMSTTERSKIRDKIDRFKKRRADYEKSIGIGNLTDYVNHIDHAVKIAGIDHVGIGTDFDGGGGIPGFENHAEALNVTVELLKRGYKEKEIKKIWGENLLRVWREVERVAQSTTL